jgi:hypothetical protein
MVPNLERSTAPVSFATTGAVIGRILKAKGQIAQEPPFEDTVEPRFIRALLTPAPGK